ncbi:ABC transporter ATP-binding protein [Pseudonocardia nematodicida]|uniref:ABC transporter ATP-binding protein n=1 Tax=Pseudonocardia nematodicida TaxID=1206997 RepID=A0ABV1K4W7_9PSEU
MDDALAVRGLHAGHPGTRVLSGVDLTVPAGAVAAVLGGSGCGKSTLLRTVAGFHPIDRGTVHLDGRLVAGDGVEIPPERRRVGLVAQEGALFGHLDVAANVGFGLDRRARRGPRVGEMLELVGLGGFGGRMPAELSGGQQQRVALARALAPAPALVLLDEPFTALDAGLRAGVRAQVRDALVAAGATAVLVTHDQEEALGIADLVAVLRDGRVAQCAPPRDLYDSPADLGVARFVGDAVVLDAHAAAGTATTALGRIPLGPGPRGTGAGQVLVRPEQLRLRPADGDGEPTAKVTDVDFHGHDAVVRLDLDGTVLQARTPGSVPLRPGDRVLVEVEGTARFFPGPHDPATDGRAAG